MNQGNQQARGGTPPAAEAAGPRAAVQRGDQQIENVADAPSTAGKSTALTAHHKKLDVDKASIAAPIDYDPQWPQVVPDVAKRPCVHREPERLTSIRIATTPL